MLSLYVMLGYSERPISILEIVSVMAQVILTNTANVIRTNIHVQSQHDAYICFPVHEVPENGLSTNCFSERETAG